VILGRPTLSESAASIADAAGLLLTEVPGVRCLSALRRGNVHGALDAGLAPGVLPGRVSLEDGRSWVAEGWGNAPAAAGRDTTAILQAAAAGDLQVLVLLGADPLRDFPDTALAKAALDRVPYIIAVDTFLTESSRQADVVLAAATFTERPGTTTNLEGRVTRLGQKITPPEVAWADWMIAVELAFRLGENLGFLSLEEIAAELERLAPVFAGLTPEVLAARANRDGVVLPLGTESRDEATVDASADPSSTPGLTEVETQGEGTGELAEADEPVLTAEDGADAPDGGDTSGERPALLTWTPGGEPQPAPKVDAYNLRVAAGRKLYDAGVMLSMAPSLAGLAAPPVLRVHPTDLERLGVTSGGSVRVRSNTLTIDAIEAVADPFQPRGTVGVPFNVPGIDTGALLAVHNPVAEIGIESL
jgi:predicted molibdopterin-dependent oxidoreductase YjgC